MNDSWVQKRFKRSARRFSPIRVPVKMGRRHANEPRFLCSRAPSSALRVTPVLTPVPALFGINGAASLLLLQLLSFLLLLLSSSPPSVLQEREGPHPSDQILPVVARSGVHQVKHLRAGVISDDLLRDNKRLAG